MLSGLGLNTGQIGRLGDRRARSCSAISTSSCPRRSSSPTTASSIACRRSRSPREIEMFRAAAQLISIGTQAAYHVTRPGVTDAEIYAAFTFAQLARGGETGDGYQIGINQYGTHCGKPYGHVVRPGDLINLYISNVTYRGYTAQTARMIAVGEITARQEKVLAACTDGVKRAEKLIRPGRTRSATSTTPPSSPISSTVCSPLRSPHHALQLGSDAGWRSSPGAAAVRARRGLGGAGSQADACLPGHERPPQSEPRPFGRDGRFAEQLQRRPRTTTTGWKRA